MQTARPADLLIEARWVLPVAPGPAALASHAVAVEHGQIIAIGPAAELGARFEARERVTLADHALLPGLINAHTCVGRLLLRGRQARRPPDAAASSPDLVRDGAQLAIAEMLRAGITAFGTRDPFPEEVARAAAAARIRAAVGLPVAERSSAWAEGVTGHLARSEQLWDEYKADPWVDFHFAPESAEALSDASLARVRTVADELDARIAMPVNGTAPGIERHMRRHGVRPLHRLDALGLLRPGFAALHPDWLEPAELELAARTGIAVILCPQAGLRHGLGARLLPALLGRGITVGLGTGSPTETFALDVLAEARISMLAGAGVRTEPLASGVRDAADEPDSLEALGACEGRLALEAQRALELATLGGAAALGLRSLTGSIEPGKAADLIAIDLSGIACRTAGEPATAIVFAAGRERISHVWINGSPRVAQGRLLAFDERELIELAARWDERL
jgi:5-methylthioadenosine/S-adenosylhomocysteine deaminase